MNPRIRLLLYLAATLSWPILGGHLAFAQDSPPEVSPRVESEPDETNGDKGDPAEEAEKLPAGAIARFGELAPEDSRTYGGTYRVLFTRDNRRLITRNLSQDIMVWDVEAGHLLHTLRGHEDRVAAVGVAPNGNFLVSAAADPGEEVRFWDLATGFQVRSVPGGARLVHFMPDNTTVMLVTETRIAHYDLPTGVTLGEFPEVRIPLAISPNGQLLAAIRRLDDDKIVLIDTTTGQEKHILPGLTGNPAAVSFSPDGKLLAASARREELVRLWDIEQQKVVMTLSGHDAQIQDIAFSGDGRFVATGSWDQTVAMWELEGGKLITGLEGHFDHVVALNFSHDCRFLASGAAGRRDSTAVVWSVRRAIAPANVPADKVNAEQLGALWKTLGDEEPKAAYAATGSMASAAPATIEYLKSDFAEGLKPAPVEVIKQLIADLDAVEFKAREKATNELLRLRAVADTLLRKTLEETNSPEVRFRIKRILSAETPKSTLSEEDWRRMRRLVFALEIMAAPGEEKSQAAHELLSLISTGHADVKVMREAAGALERLPKAEGELEQGDR